MKKKSDIARECAERLKPFGKTIEDATDFYLRHLKRKKSTGRPPGTGALSGITLGMEWADIRKRMAGDQFKTRVLDLLEMAARESFDKRMAEQMALSPAQYSKRIQARDAAARAYERYCNTPEGCAEQDARKRLANFYAKYPQYQPKLPTQRAGKEQALAASLQNEKTEPHAKVVTLMLNRRQWYPFGKSTDAMARDIYNALKTEKIGGWTFARGTPSV